MALCFSPVAAQPTELTGARTDLMEVSVLAFADGDEQKGGGWAFADTSSEAAPCRVVVPWHVVASPFGGEPAREIYVVAPGSDSHEAAYVIEPLTDRESDLAVLRIGLNKACPFDLDLASRPLEAGAFAWRVNPESYAFDAPWWLDAETDAFKPAPSGPFLTLRSRDGATLPEKWSGSSVFFNGDRIGLVVDSGTGTGHTEDNLPGLKFLPVAVMQRHFGEALNILENGDAGSALEARQALGRMGYRFTSEGVSEAMISGDVRALTLFRRAEIEIEAVARAFQRVDGKSTAYQFFDVSRGKPPLIDWFAGELARGLDPNLRVPGNHYDREALLGNALIQANIEAIRTLLEAGAAPNPPQDLDGTHFGTTRFADPLLMLKYLEELSASEKRDLAELLIVNGLVLPDAAPRRQDGSLDPYTFADRGRRVMATYDDSLGVFAPNAMPSPDLCDAPRPPLCETASRIYGYDWCQFLADTPKGFVGSGEGAYHIEPFALAYLLAIEKDRAHFLGFGPRRESPTILSVSKDRQSVTVSNFTKSYRCKPRDNGATDGFCWDTKILKPHDQDPSALRFGLWGARFFFTDSCSWIDPEEAAPLPDPLAWTEEKLAGTVQLNHLTAGLLRMLGGVAGQEAWAELVKDLSRKEPLLEANLDHNASRRSGVGPARPGYGFWDEPENWDWLVQRLAGHPSRTAELGLAERSLNFLPMMAPGLDPIPGAETALAELAESLMPNMPRRMFLVTSLPRLSLEGGVLSATGYASKLAIGPVPKWPDTAKRTEALGLAARDRAYFETKSMPMSALFRDAAVQQTLVDAAVSHWSPHRDGPARMFDYVALDRDVRFAGLPVDPERVAPLVERARAGRHAYDNWLLVTIVQDPTPEALPAPLDGAYVLEADLEEVLLIAPSGEIAASYPAAFFPLYAEERRLLAEDWSEAAFPTPLPLGLETLPFVLARFAPERLTDEVVVTMAAQRWLYERAVDQPAGGRFFHDLSVLPAPRELAAVLPQFRAFLEDRAAAVPQSFITSASGPGDTWRRRHPDAACFFTLDERGAQVRGGGRAAFLSSNFALTNCAGPGVHDAVEAAAKGVPDYNLKRVVPPLELAFRLAPGAGDGIPKEGALVTLTVTGAAQDGQGLRWSARGPDVVLPVSVQVK